MKDSCAILYNTNRMVYKKVKSLVGFFFGSENYFRPCSMENNDHAGIAQILFKTNLISSSLSEPTWL